MAEAVRLDGLLRDIEVEQVVGDAAIDITGVVHDTRSVREGSLFCCVPGTTVDGHDLAPAAIANGAVALLCERELSLRTTQVVVEETRRAMGPLAAAFWGDPSSGLEVVGVTGTNGKTTTTHLLGAIFTAAGRRAAVIGTLTGARTTPEAPELQAQLAELRDSGTGTVAMEVSSHALVQHRVAGTRFRAGVFTNLSQDHLDYHGTMEAYFQAKASLFEAGRCELAVVNIDDPWGQRLVDSLTIPWQPYGLSLVDDVAVGSDRSSCRWEGIELAVPLGGRFNLANALAAAVTARALGVPPSAIARGLAGAGTVPGRFEALDVGQPFTVIVDYAHTPDGLEQLLTAAREIAGTHRVHVVFGAGGDRDRTKRGPMGAVASRLADDVVITSDNPRSEDPRAIIEAIMDGIDDRDARLAARTLHVELDRRAGIAAALAAAEKGDVVVIAGKGHETTQTTGATVVPFDDRAVARELLT